MNATENLQQGQIPCPYRVTFTPEAVLPLSLCSCSLNAFVVVFARGLDLAPGSRKKRQEPVSLRELQKRVSGNAQDYEEVIKRAKRQSSTGGMPPGSSPGSKPTSKRASATGGYTVPPTPGTVPPTPGLCPSPAQVVAGVQSLLMRRSSLLTTNTRLLHAPLRLPLSDCI
jgi:hypothetical protein